MSKKVLIIAALASLFLAHGCENANLFDPSGSEKENNSGFGPSGEVAIAMTMQGGFAGVHRHLTIETNGYLRFVDYTAGDGQIVSLLPSRDYDALVAYFLEKDFFNLEENHFDPNAADAFVYRVQFQHGGREKTVNADEIQAPENLQDLIARLQRIIEDLKEKAPVLSLSMDRQTLRHGQSVALTLTAANPQTHDLQLTSGVQMFEFFAIPAAQGLPHPPENHPSSFVWNYTHGKAFIMIVQTTTLAAGERLTFQTTWDGRSNTGELLEGAYLVGAQLLSAPGGYTGLQTLQITQ